MTLGLALVLLPFALGAYAYLGYPLLLRLLPRRVRVRGPAEVSEWPTVTLLVPAFNAAATIAGTLDDILAFDYPRDRLQILVVSDASDDGTDDVVRSYAARGVDLLRMPTRGGKTRGENAAVAHCRGEIVVTMDAAIRAPAHALRTLVAAFADPSVGVASGRDVSAAAAAAREGTGAEAGYVGFEMALRARETAFGSIVGASGCFFGSRRILLESDYPHHLSKDFAAPLRAWRRGFRSVSVDEALCIVPRTPSLANEYRRKVRTMSRGLATLWHERDLLNPLRHGRFAWMLWSHKVVRWLVFLALPPAALGLILLAARTPAARPVLAAAVIGVAVGLLGLRWPFGGRPPRPVAVLGFALAANAAGIAAWWSAVRGDAAAVWEPTRRKGLA
jgi:cellulose synthase/poly-beta-1,6-N-acetylglucosamine synthase-like glycosyltransferase